VASKFERLNGTLTGAGDAVVVLSHGFGTDQTAWGAIRPWLDQRFRVVSFDLAGAGPGGEASYDFRRHDTLFGFADDLLEVLAELDVERCVYVSHSVSGMIGAAAAVARPEAFATLVMIGASPRYLNEPGYRGGFDQPDLDQLYDGMAANFQAWGAGFAPAVVGVPDNEAVHEFCRTLFLIRPDIALATSRTIFQSDMRAIAERLERPTHFLQTARDLAVPPEVAAWLHRHVDGSTLDILDAQGHLPHMTAPAEVLRLLEQRLMVTEGIG
jgi:sigma-B regulation protein RsbQ